MTLGHKSSVCFARLVLCLGTIHRGFHDNFPLLQFEFKVEYKLFEEKECERE